MSSKPPEPLDLERDVPTTPEDIVALKKIRESRGMSFAHYLQWLSRHPSPASPKRLRKTHESCEPFEL